MRRYLLFDSGCTACTQVAERVESEARGWLAVRSLDDPEMREILDRHRPGWSFRPTLVVIDREKVRTFTGAALSLRIAKALGVRRAARIARLVAGSGFTAGRAAAGPTRRSLLAGAGAGVGALVGFALFPKAASAGAGDDGQSLTGEQLREALRVARADRGYRDRVAEVARLGFATGRPEAAALRGADGTLVVLTFFAAQSAAQTRAAMVAHEVRPDGSARTIAEVVSRDADYATAGEPSLDQLTVSRLSNPAEPEPLDAAAYLACMLGCVGVTCSGPAANCARIPNLAAMLACIAAVCGFRAYRCHGTCRAAW